MNNTVKISGRTRMRPRARLVALLGDELISDEAVALVELVKNAYDADASRVTIAFPDPDDPTDDSITISDDGSGMKLEEVLEGWFEPGTIMKMQKDRSPGGRLLQGAKGVGRFAAARLASSLYMTTRAVDNDTVVVLLDWGKFDNNSYLDEVEIDYEVIEVEAPQTGTTLQLMNLRREWTAADFGVLHSRLSRLISPFEKKDGVGEIDGFEILLQIPSHPEYTGRVEPHELTENPKYRLTGSVTKEGIFSGALSVDGQKTITLDKAIGDAGACLECGGFEVEVRGWDRDRIGLTPYMLKYSQSLTGIRGILDTYCGVSIYRDGFRVHPYGEPGNDWLQLDARSRQNPTMRMANNQLIAAIRIDRHANSDLKDRTTREGLVLNDAYNALIEWFIRILTILEEERYGLRPRDEASREELTTLYEAFDLSEVVAQTDKQLGKKHPLAKLVKKKDSDIRDGVKRLQEHYSRVLLAAGLGQMVDLVVHEIGAPLGRINRELAHIEKMMPSLIKDDKSAAEVKSGMVSIGAWLEQIANLRSRLNPKTAGRRGRATTFDVSEEILGNLLLYDSLLGRQGIQPKLRAPKDPIAVHMSRSSLGQVVANLIDNSVYWLTSHHGSGNGGEIDIHLLPLKHGFRITLSDNGPGVEEKDRDLIFEQNFTRKAHGMGLGLYIARQVIAPYGKLIYSDSGHLPGACFVASFERKVGL